MKTFVLIFYFFYTQGGGVGVSGGAGTADFSSRETCEAAKAEIVKWHGVRAALCAEK